MIYAIGETYRGEFSTYSPTTGALTNADSLPTGKLVVNGADTLASVTISNDATGRYKVSAVLSGRSDGDICYVRVSATVGGKTQDLRLGGFRIDETIASRQPSGPVTLAAAQSFLNTNPARNFGLNPLDGYVSILLRLDEKFASSDANGMLSAWPNQGGTGADPTISAAPRYLPADGGQVIFEFDYPGVGAYLDFLGIVDRRNFTLVMAFDAHDLYPGTNSGSLNEFLFDGAASALSVYFAADFGAPAKIRVTDSGGYANSTSLFLRNRPTNILVISGDATGARFLLNGTLSTSGPFTTGTFNGGRIGQQSGSTTSAFRGRLRDFAIVNSSMTAQQMRQVSSRLFAKHSIPPIWLTIDFWGDSLALGTNSLAKTTANIAFPYLAHDAKPSLEGIEIRNFSRPGMSAAQAIGSALVDSFVNFGGAFQPGTMHIAVIEYGDNDLAVPTAPATIAGYLTTLMTQMRSKGASAIILVGPPPRTGVSLANWSGLLDLMAGLGADGFVDPRKDQRLALNDATDTLRFVGDGIHLNAEGQSVYAWLYRAELDKVIAKLAGDMYQRANAVYAKLPSRAYLTGTTDATGATADSALIATSVRDVLIAGAAANSLGATISAINTKTTNLPADPASNTQVNAAAGAVTVSAYALGKSPAELVLLTPSNKITTDLAGRVNVNTIIASTLTAIANEVEAQIIDETDSEKVLTAITDKIAAVNPSLAGLTLGAIASAVRTDVERAGGLLDTIDGKIPATFLTADDVDAVLTVNHGAGSWQSGSGGSFVGAEEVTLTFKDFSGNNVPFAEFVLRGIGSGQADSSGQAVISLNPGIYYVNVSPVNGAIWGTTTVTVASGNPTQAFTITANSSAIIPPSLPGVTRVYTTLRDAQGKVDPKAKLMFRLVIPPTGNVDSWLAGEFSIKADNDGLLQADLPANSVYEAWRGTGLPITVNVGTGPTQQLPQILERPD